ncbi:MAG: CRISPR-associated endonuclease Cas1 [Aureispira sp.]|nr:CRISPR-associated endonuclease Cas1 [Aureispira sp.]
MQLYINSYGAKLKVKDGLFQVSFWNKEQQLIRQEFAPVQIKSIFLQKGTLVTTQAIQTALEADIDILFFDKTGKATARIVATKPQNTSKVLKGQLIASQTVAGVNYVKEWLSIKIKNQKKLLEETAVRRVIPQQKTIGKANHKLSKQQQKLAKLEANSIMDIAAKIRPIEGLAGRVYFGALSKLLPKEYQFSKRSRNPAQDLFNAFLNYGYGVLYTQVESALIRAGISPYIGFLHRDGHQFKSMVYDFIEPYRFWVDQLVFRLFVKKKVSAKHCSKRGEGYWLNQQGKILLMNALYGVLNNTKQARHGAISIESRGLDKDALTFAQELKKLC